VQDLVKDFLKQRSFAVAGSFRNESKYAYRILKTLKEKGYEVYPVNPSLREVDGLRCYPNIKEIPDSVDVVDIVTPPQITEKIVRECKEKGISKVWIQPGAESKTVIEFCKDNGIKVVFNLCIMMNEM